MCLVDPYDEYKLNIYTGNSLESGFDKHRRDVWCVDNFNYVIGNPPFNQMIDMTFVQNFYHISDFVLFVHPSTWLIDEKGKQKKFNDTKNLIKDHLDSIELFNGNKVFGIQLFVPCVITYINKKKESNGIKCVDKINNTELVYDNIFQINKFSDVNVYPRLKSKIQNISKVENFLKYKNKESGDFFVNTSQIRGHVDLKSDTNMLIDDFYTIITKDTLTSDKKNKHMFFSFKSKLESDNFIKFLKTDFCRFCLSIYKNNSQLDRGEMEIIPWLDFSKEWTDKNLSKEFSLTDDELNFINKNIPKYYE